MILRSEEMALEKYRGYMETCRRCSLCKFIPMEKITGFDHVNICPSISKYKFHTYSGGGRMVMGVALLEKRIDYTKKFLEVVYNCQMCGGCDTACKYGMDVEVLEPIQEIRVRCVEQGHTLPVLDKAIESLSKQGNMVSGARQARGEWAKDLDIKNFNRDKVDVIYHVGCQTSYNQGLWKVARATANLLKKAGIDFGIGGNNELCCGGRAYQMGYQEAFLNQAKQNMEALSKSGAKVLVTGCAECYNAFKVLYDKFNMKGPFEVLHTTEYFDRLIKEGRLKPTQEIGLSVTYHDPCNLGRQGEPYIHWEGKEIVGHLRTFDPPKEYRRGTLGVYEPPRDILKSIPGLKLLEMERIKEYAWCCGAGGGVLETNPEFAKSTAEERLREAKVTTGSEAIVTSCPWCEQLFSNTIRDTGSNLKVYDIVELLEKAAL
jgi:Fe-S oxidoreductase